MGGFSHFMEENTQTPGTVISEELAAVVQSAPASHLVGERDITPDSLKVAVEGHDKREFDLGQEVVGKLVGHVIEPVELSDAESTQNAQHEGEQ